MIFATPYHPLGGRRRAGGGRGCRASTQASKFCRIQEKLSPPRPSAALRPALCSGRLCAQCTHRPPWPPWPRDLALANPWEALPLWRGSRLGLGQPLLHGGTSRRSASCLPWPRRGSGSLAAGSRASWRAVAPRTCRSWRPRRRGAAWRWTRAGSRSSARRRSHSASPRTSQAAAGGTLMPWAVRRVRPTSQDAALAAQALRGRGAAEACCIVRDGGAAGRPGGAAPPRRAGRPRGGAPGPRAGAGVRGLPPALRAGRRGAALHRAGPGGSVERPG
jgi:hypothetical protein